MRKTSILIFVFLGVLSCTSKKESVESNVDSTKEKLSMTAVDTVKKTPLPAPKTFEEINQLLYDNLVNGGFGPFSSENDSGYQELAIDSYIDGLEERGIFDREFYLHERERVEDCRVDLEELKYRGETDLGWEPNSCSFFNFMYWLRSQESPDGFEIKDLKTAGNLAQSSMVFYSDYQGERSYWNGHVYLDITYKKLGDDWKITEIKRLPDD